MEGGVLRRAFRRAKEIRKNATSVGVSRRISTGTFNDDVSQVRVDDVVATDAGERAGQLVARRRRRRRRVAMATLPRRHPAGEHHQRLFADVRERRPDVRDVALGNAERPRQPRPVAVHGRSDVGQPQYGLRRGRRRLIQHDSAAVFRCKQIRTKRCDLRCRPFGGRAENAGPNVTGGKYRIRKWGIGKWSIDLWKMLTALHPLTFCSRVFNRPFSVLSSFRSSISRAFSVDPCFAYDSGESAGTRRDALSTTMPRIQFP